VILLIFEEWASKPDLAGMRRFMKSRIVFSEMTLTAPYPPELIRVARKVVWYDSPEETLADLPTFLMHVMVYGSPADVAIVEQFVPAGEFRKVLENAPAGVFTKDLWQSWHERFGMTVPPLPRRRFPDGSVGPEAGGFFGR
jgi:hypothetical protein